MKSGRVEGQGVMSGVIRKKRSEDPFLATQFQLPTHPRSDKARNIET